MHLLYDLGIWLYGLILRLISPFYAKAKLWVEGRRGIFIRLEQTVESGSHPIWFHFASLGEFEQGRSVMEGIKKKYPDEKILITFFSPSGFEVRKNTPLADYVFYLPADTSRNARRFLDIVQPKLAVFTKYEYWYHYFKELDRRQVQLLMISSIFREEQVFFKWYGGFFRSILKRVTFFFTQNTDSVLWLKSIGITQAGLAGDTRFDRVVELPKQRRSIAEVEDFLLGSGVVLVAGSTWLPDEQLLAELLSAQKGLKIILAPHEIHDSHIRDVQQLFPKSLLLSQYATYNAVEKQQATVLVIDNIGMLSSLYGYGELAYIGGGFGAGIHNTLEAATYGLPVIFGPKYAKFQEAVDLIEVGAGFSISTVAELFEVFEALQHHVKLENASFASAKYVKEKAGATQIIMRYLADFL
ncbi:3-deoxy-D-manno-octulosonic acid transferase [Sphingobacterium psychroaquaticum]|uniref:3-deoxy-D-manno-octulosonic acid transferase n=1 Tax=Sphingobacterium psychroaquaticum TaxID=561061 RepID=UPI00106CD289|nr:glycosyltransferase N-terminal domain-containing protein [Sphingobacterium psychroaquaticum]QBQ42702.1 3-deoxy-D-manno-octulosonic acid transferase [Sphingobacterium psychroaquaticum]